MWVAVESQLTGNTCRQTVEYSQILLGEVSLNKVDRLVTIQVLCLRQSQNVVQLSNQLLDSRNELDNTLWDDNGTEVVTISSTLANSVSDVSYDIVEAHTLLLDLLRNQADVWLSLQSALQSDVRS